MNILFNLYRTLDQYNLSEGAQVILEHPTDITGGLVTHLLVGSFYLLVALGIYMAQRKAVGSGNFFMSFATSGLVTIGLVGFLKVLDGMVGGGIISGQAVTIWIVIGIVSLAGFMFGSKETG